MNHPRSFSILLPDGAPTGLVVVKDKNWPGSIIIFPRARLDALFRREEAQRSGIYFLLGDDTDELGKKLIYIGESDAVANRLRHHAQDESKEFFVKGCIITSPDLTKADIRYLEAAFVIQAKRSGRARIVNTASPTLPPLPEADIANMQRFIVQIESVLAVLGWDFLLPKPGATFAAVPMNPELATARPVHVAPASTASPVQESAKRTEMAPQTLSKADLPAFSPMANSGEVFELRQRDVHAVAVEVDEGFVVRRGSTARKLGTEVSRDRPFRDGLVAQGKLVQDANPDLYRFADDVVFSSPSRAGGVVLDRNCSGGSAWRHQATGVLYRDFLAKRLEGVQ